MTPSANIPFEHKVRLIMLVDDDPPCGAARNAGLIRSAGRSLGTWPKFLSTTASSNSTVSGSAVLLNAKEPTTPPVVFATAPAIMIAGPGVRSRERRKLARNVNVHRSH